MSLVKEWEEAFSLAQEARIIFFLGRSDIGKTTALLTLANALYAQKYSVGIVDADIGQSSIGPPTTIGFGVLERPVSRLEEVTLQGLYFVGSITPVGHLLPTVVGTAHLVRKALQLGIEKVLIDTSGLVNGDLGRVLKQHKIELVSPDLIYCLQADRECEGILRAYSHRSRLRIVRLRPSPERRIRSPEERRAYREERFTCYFATAERREVYLHEIDLMGSALFTGKPVEYKKRKALTALINIPILWGEILSGEEAVLVTPLSLSEMQIQKIKRELGKRWVHVYPLSSFKNLLLGLQGEDGEVVSLGILHYIDFPRGILTLSTPLKNIPIRGIRFSRFQYP